MTSNNRSCIPPDSMVSQQQTNIDFETTELGLSGCMGEFQP